ncbi:MAG: ABC transporter permease [Dehalococcoidia bacterium]|nr:ABC transporter permease [Dehalococcoidia bacterium]
MCRSGLSTLRRQGSGQRDRTLEVVAVARTNLFAEKTRLLITVGGVAFSILLIVILWSLYQAWNTKITAYTDSTDADLWVGQEGAMDMFHSVSLLPTEAQEAIEAVPGVATVRPFIGRQVAFRLRGKEVNTFLVGYEPDTGLGGPVRVVSGRGVAAPGEIVVDTVFARSNGLKVGSQLSVLDRPFTVVGISTEENRFVNQYSFVLQDDAREALTSRAFNNYCLVKTASNAAREAVKNAIDALPRVQAITKKEFKELSRGIIDSTFLPIIIVLVAIGIAVGTAVIRLTIYTGTVEKSREYAVLKEVGASNWRLYRIVLEQALLASLIGYGVGVAVSFGAIALIEREVPAFLTAVRAADLASILGIALGVAIVASAVPLRRMLSLDPAVVFKQ